MSTDPSRGSTDAEEREIMPGVFMTDFRRPTANSSNNSNNSSNAASSDAGLHGDETETEELDRIVAAMADAGELATEVELDRLRNSITHLVRSNKELHEFDPDGRDAELVEAIVENVAVIAKQQRLIAALEDMLLQRFGRKPRSRRHQESHYRDAALAEALQADGGAREAAENAATLTPSSSASASATTTATGTEQAQQVAQDQGAWL
ncbi:hypothetical protein CAOG_01987 [Capsaspora owczarzaki ATCC 30864]|uniref:Uncharacterized protein n=1 Tax=Capsaspora owczarzaki (strain ATCC 30864) TaxID=595528 RepID=A0A0D2X1F7_CAPO3|nr:hypothetical protein CAOG_01987 [Capsaspora owczarzaki ATCC 30864]KJE90729.1 hypothetical protein CAOG_001987 [Capsaspora owczarzaki ATCC 30864]|eukprot:XP_004364855.1 hypothetical protein CAOG_01987 [Capsaspora owczarzaki ATCC 30864]